MEDKNGDREEELTYIIIGCRYLLSSVMCVERKFLRLCHLAMQQFVEGGDPNGEYTAPQRKTNGYIGTACHIDGNNFLKAKRFLRVCRTPECSAVADRLCSLPDRVKTLNTKHRFSSLHKRARLCSAGRFAASPSHPASINRQHFTAHVETRPACEIHH